MTWMYFITRFLKSSVLIRIGIILFRFVCNTADECVQLWPDGTQNGVVMDQSCVSICLTVYNNYITPEQSHCHSASTEMCPISCMSHFRSTRFHTINARICLFVYVSVSTTTVVRSNE